MRQGKESKEALKAIEFTVNMMKTKKKYLNTPLAKQIFRKRKGVN